MKTVVLICDHCGRCFMRRSGLVAAAKRRGIAKTYCDQVCMGRARAIAECDRRERTKAYQARYYREHRARKSELTRERRLRELRGEPKPKRGRPPAVTAICYVGSPEAAR